MASARMLRPTNVFRSLCSGPFRLNGSRLLATAAQPLESDDSPGKFPEVDEPGVIRILEALNQQEKVDGAMQTWNGLVGHQTASKVLQQLESCTAALSFFEWAGKQERFGKHRIESYRLLLQKVAAGGMGKETRRVMLEMQNCGLFLKKKSVREIIDQLLKLNQSEDVVGIVEDMLHIHWVNLLEEIVQACCEGGKMDVAWTTLQLIVSKEVSLHRKNAVPELALMIVDKMDDGEGWAGLDKVLKKDTDYNKVIDMLCKQQRMEQACNVLDKMVEAGLKPTACSYAPVAVGLAKASKLQEALALLDVMMEQGCQPDAPVYNPVLDGLCKTGKVKKAFKLFKMMKESGGSANTCTYNALINGLCLEGKPHMAQSVMENMIKDGCVPDVVTYTLLINRLRKDGDVKAGVKLFEVMLSKGCVPDRDTYVCLVTRLCRETDVQVVKQFVEKHTQRFDMDLHIYNALISCYGKNGLLKEARELYERMKKRGLAPTLIVLNIFLSALCQSSQVDEALEVYKAMPKALRPDRYTYTILMGGLCDLGRTDEACALMETMVENKCKPDKVTYGVLVAGLVRAGKFSEAENMRKKMAAADIPSS